MLYSTLFTLALSAITATAAPLEKRDYNGRGTFYAVGLGNCGWYSSANEKVVAMNTAQYGPTSQVSGTCGQTVTINYNGNTQQATVVDSCPTCPYGGLDMSESLFSALTGGNMGLGVIQMSWHFGSGSGSSGSSSSSSKSSSSSNNNDNSNKSSNNNNNNNNNNNYNNQQKASTPTTTKSTPTAAKTASATATPSNTAQKLTSGMPQWWAEIGNANCPDVKLPDGVEPFMVAPSGNAENDTLPAACGKWVQVWNVANNKSTKAMLTNYDLEAPRGNVYMGDAYLAIADMNGENPQAIQNVTWGFLN